MKALVAYDGTLQGKAALQYGLWKMRKVEGELTVLSVFNSGLFYGYDSVPNAEAVARREFDKRLGEAEEIIRREKNGMRVTLITEEGRPGEIVLRCALEESVDIVYAPPRYQSALRRAECRVAIVPGTIVVPVDNTDPLPEILDELVAEAVAMASYVTLLGIVPVHLYTAAEGKLLKKVEQGTLDEIARVKKLLQERGVATKEVIRKGFPDEEILRTACSGPVSMIFFLADQTQASELTKAANIILDESESSNCLRMPILGHFQVSFSH